MGVRKYEELSDILMRITNHLLSNQTLCKLLYYNDSDPLAQIDVKNTKTTLFNKVIKIIPKVGTQEIDRNILVLVWEKATKNLDNQEINDLDFSIHLYCPFNTWIIKGDKLRPFYILSEIEKSLQGKNVNGIGRLNSQGFFLDLITDELCSYKMEFNIDVFN